MDAAQIEPLLTMRPAPVAVFDRLETHGELPRYHVTDKSGAVVRTVTWSEHGEQIRSVAAFLAAHRVGPGDTATIFSSNRVEWMSAALGIQTAGAAIVPIYPASTAEQAAYVIGHSDAKVLFTDAHLLARLLARPDSLGALDIVVLFDDTTPTLPAGCGARAMRFSEVLAAGASAPRALLAEQLAAIDLDSPGTMLYTSGTSGNPKGVPLTHRNVGVNGRDWLVCNGPLVEPGDVDLLWLPMSHIFGFGEASLGNTLAFTTTLCDPASVLGLLPRVRPQVFMSVPSLWEKLATIAQSEATPGHQRERLREITGGRLRFCLSGGAGLKREVKEFFHGAGLLIVEGYGLTETSPTLTLNRPDAFRFDTVGKVLPSVEVKLAEDGEILARGESVFRGYHKDPEATRAAFDDDGWFKTGDVGRFTEDGFLQIIDRKKDILVTAGGKNVAPANIELRFRDDPLVAHAMVYGDGKRYLTCALWASPEGIRQKLGDDVDVDRLRLALQESVDRVNQGLASYETIKRFALIDEPLTVEGGFLTSTLKLRRKQVTHTFKEQLEALYE